MSAFWSGWRRTVRKREEGLQRCTSAGVFWEKRSDVQLFITTSPLLMSFSWLLAKLNYRNYTSVRELIIIRWVFLCLTSCVLLDPVTLPRGRFICLFIYVCLFPQCQLAFAMHNCSQICITKIIHHINASLRCVFCCCCCILFALRSVCCYCCSWGPWRCAPLQRCSS